MSNTKDLIGEQATLDGLVSRTLENFEDDGITHIREFLFDSNYTIKSISLPNCREYNSLNASAAGYKFHDCRNLHTVYLPSLDKIGIHDFDGCYSLNNVTFDEEISVGEYGFANCFSLGNLNGYVLSVISSRAFESTGIGRLEVKDSKFGNSNMFYKSRISTLDITKNEALLPPSMYANSLAYMHSLCHLIIRRDDGVMRLSSTTGFLNETPIKQGIGWIYVQPEMVDLYKADTNWSYFADQIVSINEYPKTLQDETISDSWEQILQSQDNGTYNTKYNIGDTKYLVIGDTYVPMQIAAFDKDVLSSDGVSTAKITWISRGASFTFPFSIISDGGVNKWEDCGCREFLRSTVYNNIDPIVKNRIVDVFKTSRNNVNEITTSDNIWIPSKREVGFASSESEGVVYTDYFNPEDTSTQKVEGIYSGGSRLWCTRTSNYSNNVFITNGVSNGNANVVNIQGIVIGFCTS